MMENTEAVLQRCEIMLLHRNGAWQETKHIQEGW